MKKLYALLLLCLSASVLPMGAYGQTGFDFDDIDALLENQTLDDAATRYGAVLSALFPERATRLGITSANNKLDDRSPRAASQAISALRTVQETLGEIKKDKLSDNRQADYDLLSQAIENDLRVLAQNRVATDPLYYAEALDAIYDVMLKEDASLARRRTDVTARLRALPTVVAQAEQNLTQAPAFLSEQAMEKAYYMYLSFDEIVNFLLEGAQDEFAVAQVKQEGRAGKQAVKQLFDVFKRLSQAETTQDFRLGRENYGTLLAKRYQITDKSEKVMKRLEKDFLAAQHQLADALEPFLLETSDDEVTVIDGLNAQPTVQAQKKTKKKKAKKGEFVPPTAQAFYKVAENITTAPDEKDLLENIQQEAIAFDNNLVDSRVLPAHRAAFNIQPMTQYHAYTFAHALIPAYEVPSATTFYVRLPTGNRLAKAQQLKQDFNVPSLKIMTAQELVPGKYYQQAFAGSSLLRRRYGSETLANGWGEYALNLAQERGYLVTDDELLFLAWQEYVRTATALADARVHTKKYSYADAISFLVDENGFKQEEAEQIVKSISSHPGQAVSVSYGAEVLSDLRTKYAKKFGKKFNLADFHSKVLKAGNVPPKDLENEVSLLYAKEKRQAKEAPAF